MIYRVLTFLFGRAPFGVGLSATSPRSLIRKETSYKIQTPLPVGFPLQSLTQAPHHRVYVPSILFFKETLREHVETHGRASLQYINPVGATSL